MATFYVGRDKISWNAVMLRIGSYFPMVGASNVRGIPGDPKHFVHYHEGDDEYKMNEKPDSAYNYFGETEINLKYVPKKLKNAEYNSFVDWFKAVYSFIRESKDTASMKSKMKTQQNRTSNQQAEVQRKQTVKLTVQGLDATKMQELISLVMEQLK